MGRSPVVRERPPVREPGHPVRHAEPPVGGALFPDGAVAPFLLGAAVCVAAGLPTTVQGTLRAARPGMTVASWFAAVGVKIMLLVWLPVSMAARREARIGTG